jgi:hypothetical protein
MKTVILTKQQISSVFKTWIDEYRNDPDSFIAIDNDENVSSKDGGKCRAEAFLDILTKKGIILKEQ